MVFLLLLGSCGLLTATPDKPNFIYIMADELAYFDPGFMGNQEIQTPNLDRMAKEVSLEGNHGLGKPGKTHAQYVIHEAATKWIREHAREPFFAYLPYTPPHGIYAMPDNDPALALYQDKPWDKDKRLYAAMTTQHDYLYWERDDNRAIRQGNWRAVKPGKGAGWELYDVANDPSESRNLAAKHPDLLARLSALAEQAHTPLRTGTFTTTEFLERDRRAKFGRQDEIDAPEKKGKKAKAVIKE